MTDNYILHLDGDSFFAACEISLNPKLRGKPVVTGQERGIATAMSREAKALGVHRGMPVFQIRRDYPEVIIVNSNYRTYGIFAERMYNIVRRYTPFVEEYSIDECFARLPTPERSSGGQADPTIIAKAIKADLKRELGLTFSLGLAPTKVLAKIASKWNKPDGFTRIEPADIRGFLKDLPIGKVWGIGPSTSHRLHSLGIVTALDFIDRPLRWIEANLSRPETSLWHELRGTAVHEVHHEPDDDQSSIQTTRTFSPKTRDKKILLSELSRNVEHACQKARRAGLATRHIYYFLKTQEFRYHRFEIPLTHPTQNPAEILREIKATFGRVYRPGIEYRATGVSLSGLRPLEAFQNDLFGEVVEKEKKRHVWKTADTIDRRFGTDTILLASSLTATKKRGVRPERLLWIPSLGEVV